MNVKGKDDIIRKYLNNSCSKEEFETVYEILSSSEKFDDYDEVWKKLWETSLNKANAISPPDLQHEAGRLISNHKPKTAKIISLPVKRYLQVAAVLIFVALGWLLVTLIPTSQSSLTVHKANHGEIKEVNLADGSTVNIGAASELIISKNFNKRARNVSLTGQAFFSVEKDEKRKFIVNTENLKVTVMGTSFTIRSFDSEETSVVTVLTGKVKIDILGTDQKKAQYLTPNNQLEYNKTTGEITITEVDARKYNEWIDKNLYYDKTPLYRVITDLENMYKVELKLASTAINDARISGEYSNAGLDQILETICFVHNLQYRWVSDNTIIIGPESR
jgi:transmembrane sensor